jgi:hypothetical protein
MHAVVLAFALAAAPAFAGEMVYREDAHTTLRLQEAPCPDKVGDLLKDEVRDRFKAAHLLIHGTEYLACWVAHDSTRIYVHYEDDDRAILYKHLFKPAPGV